MKKISLYIIIMLITVVVHSQTWNFGSVYTKNNTAVEALTLTSGELSSGDKAFLVNDAFSNYGVTPVSSPTRQYNCHGFAWHLSEGHSDSVWINALDNSSNPNIDGYWTDGSFIQVCSEGDADKIHYYMGDHSAVISSVSGKYESKWGNSLRTIHDPTNVPSIYQSAYRKYYASTAIYGSTDALCSSTRTFSIKNISGATYTWTYSTNLTATSGTSSSSITVQQNGSNHGTAWVQCVVSSPCSASSVTTIKYFSVGLPDITGGSGLQIYDGTSGTYNLFCNGDEVTYDFGTTLNSTGLWTNVSVVPGGYSYTTLNDADLYLYLWKTGQIGVFRLDATNTCGTYSLSFAFQVVSCARSYTISPNPSSSNISIKSLNAGTEIKEIRILDKYGNIKKRVNFSSKITVAQINISSLAPDVYFLQIYDGTNWLTKQMIKK